MAMWNNKMVNDNEYRNHNEHRNRWNNGVSWLVARFAIVPKKHRNILNPCIVWQVRYCGKTSWETVLKKNMFEWNTLNIFSAKNCACLPFPKESNCSLNPYLKTVFRQSSKALGHERVRFTLLGLFSGFRIAAFFSPSTTSATSTTSTTNNSNSSAKTSSN